MKRLFFILFLSFPSFAFVEKSFFQKFSLNWQKQSIEITTVREMEKIDKKQIKNWAELRYQSNQNIKVLLERILSLKLSKMYLTSDMTIGAKLNSNKFFRRRYNEFFYHKKTKFFHFNYKDKYIIGKLFLKLTGKNGLLNFIDYPFGREKIPIFEKFSSVNNEDYTGLIIDASLLKIKTALFPRIYTDKGLEFYSPLYVQKENLIQNGYINYEDNFKKAYQNIHKIGKNPYIISAISEKNNIDIVISTQNAIEFLSSTKNRNRLENGRVILIIGKTL